MPLHSLRGHRRSSLNTGSHSSNEDPRPDSSRGAEDDSTMVEPAERNIIAHIISQLQQGADFSRITLPASILEPRSMLERITNFMAHPDTLLPMPTVEDPVKRFISVMKFYLSGWHIKPRGLKKPLNPILGETFTGYWDYPDKTRGYYIAEQTEHHPPKSSYFFMAPDHGIRVDGTLKPVSKLVRASAASEMHGISYLRLMNVGETRGGEKYIITQPNMYARWIVFGYRIYELGGVSSVRCPETNLAAEIDFKTKPTFGGTYNAIGGVIRNEKTGETLYELSGLWSEEMFIKDVVTGHKELLFNATDAKHAPPQTRPLAEQTERESQKLWYHTVQAVKTGNYDKATAEKSKIEERQREETAKREAENVEWRRKLFRQVRAGPGESEEGEEQLEWILNATIDAKDPRGMTEQILAVAPILPGQKPNAESENTSSEQSFVSSSQKNEGDQTGKKGPLSSESENNLIDFDDDEVEKPKSAAAPAAHQPPNHRTRSVSLIGDYRHTNAINDNMERMNLMDQKKAQSKITSPSLTNQEQPLVRTDTQTTEDDAFYDAQS